MKSIKNASCVEAEFVGVEYVIRSIEGEPIAGFAVEFDSVQGRVWQTVAVAAERTGDVNPELIKLIRLLDRNIILPSRADGSGLDGNPDLERVAQSLNGLSGVACRLDVNDGSVQLIAVVAEASLPEAGPQNGSLEDPSGHDTDARESSMERCLRPSADKANTIGSAASEDPLTVGRPVLDGPLDQQGIDGVNGRQDWLQAGDQSEASRRSGRSPDPVAVAAEVADKTLADLLGNVDLLARIEAAGIGVVLGLLREKRWKGNAAGLRAAVRTASAQKRLDAVGDSNSLRQELWELYFVTIDGEV